MQQPVMFYSPRRSINSSQSVPLDGAFWTAIQGEQLLPAQPAPCPSHTHRVPFQRKEPPKTPATRGSCGAEGRVVLREGASSSKLSFPSFLQPQNRAKQEPVPEGDPEASSGTWEDLGWGVRFLLGSVACGGDRTGKSQGRAEHFPASPLSSPSCTP